MPYERKAGDPPEGSWIPKSELVPFGWYAGTCRNSEMAQWIPKKNGTGVFVYIRHKWADTFAETAPHPEDDNGFDCFFPFSYIDTREIYSLALGLKK